MAIYSDCWLPSARVECEPEHAMRWYGSTDDSIFALTFDTCAGYISFASCVGFVVKQIGNRPRIVALA